MASSSRSRVLAPSDALYFLSFTAGMAAFWLGGHTARLLPTTNSQVLSVAAGLIVTAGIYGLGMLGVAVLIQRRLNRAVIIATAIAVVLGLVAAQVIVRVAADHVHTRTDLGLLTFVLYLCYGSIYPLALALGRKFSRSL